ncbi:phospholipase A1-IIgamma [Cornus florida]|uniref:phospholipase A1-IIgamma n=1 Tax=Cornus florida TaxID=4283 RepID=UPI00289D80DA|nr:phospholipase A1-IIgamma [Cornus florida]
MVGSVAQRWRLLSGQYNWKKLLNPLDKDLRPYIIHYGEMAQATYDTFNSDKESKYAGSSRYSRKNLFAMVGLTLGHPYRYTCTKYVYAMSRVGVPESFIFKSSSKEAWCQQSNWMGYVAVATDKAKVALGRRDILVAWRGTVQELEWVKDFDFPLTSAAKILGKEGNPQVHRGWLSIYTSDDPHTRFNKVSAREQVLTEVKRLVEQFKNEEISITITGHSLGAALGTLNAADIMANVLNKRLDMSKKPCPVTAFLFASPHVGDFQFRNVVQSMKNLHFLRVKNVPDIVPYYPMFGYTDVGEELVIDTRKSNFLKSPGNFTTWHNLETYLHGIAGTQGPQRAFHLDVKRDIALVNKSIDGLKEEYMVPASWWCEKNKGMVQQNDGSWKLEDHQNDDSEEVDY